MRDTVSVIITTKNEADRLPACLESIKKQTYKHIETIVVDNHSSDATKDIAKNFGVRVLDEGPERSAQRNFGAQKSKGKYLLFLDADMELTPGVVGECVKIMGHKTMSRGQKAENPSASSGLRTGIAENNKQDCSLLIDHCPNLLALVIPEKSFGIGFWAQCKALERSFYLNVPWIESARFFQKKAYLVVGGYDETLTGPEDFELAQRVKQHFGEECTGRISSFILHNEGKLSLGKTLKKKYYYGKKMSEYRKKQSAKGYFDKQANIFERYRLFFRKSSIIRHSPITFGGMVIMKTLEMGAVMIGANFR